MSINSMSEDEAQRIAISGLSFLAQDEEHLARFLSETGIGPETIRTAARDPGFLAGVLDFLMSDEALLLAFTESVRLRPTLVAVARHKLDRHGDGGWQG